MSDSTWYPRDSEAESLALQLRTQRLTLLYGAAGSGKTTLLTAGVLPLLHRRSTDEFTGIQSSRGVVLPFPDRRNADDATEIEATLVISQMPEGSSVADSPAASAVEADAEVAVFFDAWDEAPLEGLLERMREALRFPSTDGVNKRRSLASTLGSFHRQRGGKSLIVLDKFEEFLVRPENAPGIRQFSDALVDAMNRPGLPVHFLIGLNEDAAPLLERFRGRIAGLDDHCMRLPPLRRPPEGPPSVPVLRQVPDGYRPPIDLELPAGIPPPSIPPHEPTHDIARTTGPGALYGDTPPDFATSRQPEWLDDAFTTPTGHMKTQDVYASMESLLGKIVQGTRQAEERAAANPASTAQSPAMRRAHSESVTPTVARPAAPQPVTPAPSATGAHTARSPDPFVTPLAGNGASAIPATEPVGSAQVAQAVQSSQSSPERSAGAATPQNGQGSASVAAAAATSPATAAASAPIVHEFGPLFTFETPESSPALAGTYPAGRAPARVEPVISLHGGTAQASEPAVAPANADWLAEVHASLTKLASQNENNPANAGLAGSMIDADIAAGSQDEPPSARGNTATRVVAIIAILVAVIVLGGAAAILLPPEWRPFELPSAITSLIPQAQR